MTTEKVENKAHYAVWNAKVTDLKIYETVETLRGNKTERIKSSLFYFLGFFCLPIGIFLIAKEIWFGAFLILTVRHQRS